MTQTTTVGICLTDPTDQQSRLLKCLQSNHWKLLVWDSLK